MMSTFQTQGPVSGRAANGYPRRGADTHLGAVVRPRAELHGAILEVKGEEGDVDGAG